MESRPRKLRKSIRISDPPRLQPLSFCSEPLFPDLVLPENPRKLVKHRQTLTHLSSTDTAFAIASQPSPPLASKSSSLFRNFSLRSWRSSPTTHSDPPNSLPLIRVVSPLIIPDYDARRPKFSLDDPPDHSPTSSSSHIPLSSHAPRPNLVRRHATVGTTVSPPRRRWTLAMALTDEAITDEVLIEELEKMRIHRDWNGDIGHFWSAGDFWDAGREIWGASRTLTHPDQDSPPSEQHHDAQYWDTSANGALTSSPVSESIPYTPSLPSFPVHHRLSTPTPASLTTADISPPWPTARRALLTCRELIRTERHYLASLRLLFSGATLTPPPPLMLRYVTELIRVSEAFLARMQENPSAWGVAAAFLGCEDGAGDAYVGWCGVVGVWFREGNGNTTSCASTSGSTTATPPRRKLSKARLVDKETALRRDRESKPKDGSTSPTATSPTTTSPPVSLANLSPTKWRMSLPTLDISTTPIPSLPSPVFNGSFLNRRTRKESKDGMENKEKEKETTTRPKPVRVPSVRDLAIQPTQRVMRYVLLYQDLLAHTPSTSPSRALVERAVEAACRMAQKCDRAQMNAAFFTGVRGEAPASRRGDEVALGSEGDRGPGVGRVQSTVGARGKSFFLSGSLSPPPRFTRPKSFAAK